MVRSGRPVLPSKVTGLVNDGVITVAVTGRVDQLTAAAFSEELLDVWPVCVGDLAVNLSVCTYLCAGAVQALQKVWRWSPLVPEQLQVAANHPDVTAVLDSVNLPRIRTPGRDARDRALAGG